MSKGVVPRNFLKSLYAVLIGNAIYFLILSPVLPYRARHVAPRLDLGIAVDFWVCVVVYGVIEILSRKKSQNERQS